MFVIIGWVGVVLYLVGAGWLTYLAYSNNQVGMAVGCFCLAPVFGTIYGIQNFDEAKIPLGLMWAGFVLRIVGFVLASAITGTT